MGMMICSVLSPVKLVRLETLLLGAASTVHYLVATIQNCSLDIPCPMIRADCRLIEFKKWRLLSRTTPQQGSPKS